MCTFQIFVGILAIYFIYNWNLAGYYYSGKSIKLIQLNEYDNPITSYKSDFKSFGDKYHLVSKQFGGQVVNVKNSSLNEGNNCTR